MNHPLVYNLEIGAFAFHVRDLTCTEELSRSWRIELAFVLDPQTMRGLPAAFDPDVVIKETASVLLDRGGVVVRRIQGIVTEVEVGTAIGGHPEVTMVLEPRLALLKHRRDIRIHRNRTVPQIVTEVAEALGVKVDNRLRESYPSRPYCVEWRESDYDYINRLLEDEGIFYYFSDGDEMVLGDGPHAYQDIPGDPSLPFRHLAGLDQNDDAVFELGTRAALTAGTVTLRDWNTEHPNLDMDVSHATALPFGPEWYDYPGEYETPEAGRAKARLHAEAFDRAAAAVVGRSSSGRLFPGSTFVLLDPPPASVEPGRYVVRSVQHAWKRDSVGFAVTFEADPKHLTYRPPRTTFVPRIFNPLTGIVCTNGEDIQCDHFGRVKVHFHWDRLRPHDDDCSHWIPVLQDNTGGSSAIPRREWEVLVHFMEGDPDRPIVLGRVFNGEDPFAERLPSMRDYSSIASMTSPTRKTRHELRFEDVAGAEKISLLAPKDMNIRVANDQTADIRASNTFTVGNDESVRVGGNADWDVGGGYGPNVGNDQTWEVTGNRIKKIGESDTSAVAGNHKLAIGGIHEREVFVDVVYAAKNLKEKFKTLDEQFREKHTTFVGGKAELKVAASYSQRAAAGKSESTTKNRTETIVASHTLNAGEEVQMRCDRTRTTMVTGAVTASCNEVLTLTGAQSFTSHSAVGSFNADVDLMLVVRDKPTGEAGGNESWVVFRNGVIEIKAVDDVTIDIAGTNNQGSGGASQI
jgi:type VI secretion system secreted protein VgrG